MKLLIIGGTRFLGRAIVEAALVAGHEVTLFNRGQSNPGLYANLETLVGNRDGGLGVLHGHRWDAVIDTCGYVPRLVQDSATLLADTVELYTFISSISVYADPSVAHIDEDAPLGTIEDETVETVDGETYGPLKVLCEKAATKSMHGRALNVRAGLIVGPHDLSDRFTYWPCRVARGGEVLSPGDPDSFVQFIDVRDIAAWTVQATEKRLTGAYNVTGPNKPITMSQLLHACQEISGSDATFTWVSEAFLEANEVELYTEMPLWVPAAFAGFDTVNCQKAIKAGLVTRPLPITIRDTLDWANGRPADYQWRNGMKPEREADLLARWSAIGNR